MIAVWTHEKERNEESAFTAKRSGSRVSAGTPLATSLAHGPGEPDGERHLNASPDGGRNCYTQNANRHADRS